MAYAARHRQQVAGMVQLDATNPNRSTRTGSVHAGPPSAIAVGPVFARLGAGRLLPTSFWAALPEPAAGQYRAFAAGPRGWRNTVEEVATMPELVGQAQALTALGNAPVVVLTAAGHDSDADWKAAQDRMAALTAGRDSGPAATYRGCPGVPNQSVWDLRTPGGGAATTPPE